MAASTAGPSRGPANSVLHTAPSHAGLTEEDIARELLARGGAGPGGITVIGDLPTLQDIAQKLRGSA